MKSKLLQLAIFIMASLGMIGCGKYEETQEEQYYIYYIDRNENHISAVPYSPINASQEKEKLVTELLEQLAVQVDDIKFQPVIQGFEVKDYIVRDGQIIINLSKEYGQLKTTKEVLVRAAIVKTLTQITGVEFISMKVNGKDLADTLGNTVGIMSAETFIDNTGEDMKNYEEVTLTLYFSNETGDRLIKVNRTMRYNTNIALEKLVVEQLLYGPVEKKGKENTMSIFPTLNSETKIISVSIKDGICYVNLNTAFLTLMNNVTADTAIYSIVNSLTELPGVTKVQLAVDGETEVKLGDETLSVVFERNPDLIQAEESKKK